MFVRARRRFVSSLLILGLLFSQLAVAAYACTKLEAAGAPAVDVVQGVMPCEEMGMGDIGRTDEPARCLEHCKYGQQNVSPIAPVDVPVGAMVVLFELPPFASATPTLLFVQPTLLARSTAPPEYARSQRLRI